MSYCIALRNKETGKYELSAHETGWLVLITDEEEALKILQEKLGEYGTRNVRLLRMVSFKVKIKVTMDE